MINTPSQDQTFFARRKLIETGSIALVLVSSYIIFRHLGANSFIRPIEIRNWILALAWVLAALVLAGLSIAPLVRRNSTILTRAGAGARVVTAVLLLAFFTLTTDIGILMAGHRYWMSRAYRAPSLDEAERCLKIVFHSTQYGRDIARNGIASFPEGPRKEALESTWCRLVKKEDCL